ncbi:MAG TPA: hypothetical protein VF759_14125 [Allosphingosinicella sp.]
MRAWPAGASLLAAFALAAAPAGAQERTPDTPLDRFGLIEGEQLQFTSGTEEDKLTFGVSLPTGPSQKSIFSLLVSTPFKSDDGVLPSSLDALANGTTATLRWGRFGLGTPDPDERAVEISKQAIAECKARRANPNPGDDPNLTVAGCETEPNNNIVRNYAKARYREFLAHIIHSDATDFGFEASVGFNDFEWIDPATFAPQKERRTGWSVTGHYNQYLRRTKTAIILSAAYQRAYEAAEEKLICPPVTTDPASQCKNARGAAPQRNENLLLTAGIRHQFMRDGTLLNLAVAPAVTYDAIDDVFGVELPVYFVPDKDGRLSGGVRFGYRSDREDKFTVGVFFATTFSILQ